MDWLFEPKWWRPPLSSFPPNRNAACVMYHIELPEPLRNLRLSKRQKDFWSVDREVRAFVCSLEKEEVYAFADSKGIEHALSIVRNEELREELRLYLHMSEFSRRFHLFCRIRKSQELANSVLFFKAMNYRNRGIGTEYFLHVVRTRDNDTDWPRFNEKIVLDALRANNRKFFIQLGKALSSKPGKRLDPTRVDRKALLMVEAWFENGNKFPDLCQFTDEALVDFFEVAFPTAKVSLDNVRKMRQRLRLVKADRPRVRRVTVRGNEILFEV